MENDYRTSRPNGFVEKVAAIIVASTTFCYILVSIIKRFADNNSLLIIPLCIIIANFFILLELLYLIKFKRADCPKKTLRLVVFEIVVNFCFVLYILSFFFG